MPGYLVEQAAQVDCMHKGTCKPMPVSPRVKLGGSAAVLKTSALTIAGCTLPPPPAANGPDVAGAWTSAATRVRSMGVPLVLSDSQAKCVASGLGVLILRTQFRVKGI